ncbi:MAG TPA: DNA polymerase III subunit alpha [Patescibacteria group bacterium]|nr:DNA polymerase III subunit alpha [Patescibacteria group bacterium]
MNNQEFQQNPKSGAAFTHLHVHSHFSLLDGLSQIPQLTAAAKNLGFESLALTDHGVMYGVIEFYNACLDAGIKPIIGVEAYVAPRSLSDKDSKEDANYFHLTLLAADELGYHNLLKLTTIAHTQGFYYKPRIDLEVLREHSQGLICLSGCQRGEIARAALHKSETEAQASLEKYLQIFGPEKLFIEIQRNSLNLDPQEEKLNQRLIALARKNNLRVVATSDCHYINPEDAEAQDVLVCIGTGKTVQDDDRLDMRSHDLSLKSAERMAELFADIPEAVSNTQIVADMCNLKILTNQRYFPQVELPEGKTSAEFLRDLTYDRANILYGHNGEIPVDIRQRIDYELDIIIKKGFDTYFLMVADVVEGAHKIGAITNTRGSAAGSIVGRSLGITNVDPLYYELPFERFLTEFRPTPPDIDLDIADNRRDEAIAYITEKYGHEKVAQIITFGTMMARAAVRDVGRALGIPYSKCDKIAKMIPLGKQGFHMTLDKALDMNAELKSVYERDPETRQILDIARKLEGSARHASIHAAGIVITPTALTDYMPLQLEPDGNRTITQYDMYALDVNANSKAIGVVKLDLLGIRNLSILEASVRIAQARHGVAIDIYNLPHPDPKTFKLLSEGHTFGVFQLGSQGMTRYMKELKPKNIFDIMAMIALYRPGPMGIIPEYIQRMHRPSKVEYFDPRMEEYLKRSLGLLVYQDDVLSTAVKIAGYSYVDADKLRKAMGKKIPAEMAKQKAKFIEGCMQGGMSNQKATDLFGLIEPFAAYGFGKSHAASYAAVSYQTAYMKANYTVEFMAAVMTAESGDMDTVVEAVEECRNLQIFVLPPDVNESMSNFTVIDEHHIRFGLNAIKNLGSDVVEAIRQARKESGKFENIEDFVTRINVRNFNKKSWEALTKSGALDSLGERGKLLANTELILEFARNRLRDLSSNQTSLFGNLPQSRAKLTLRDSEPATKKETLAWEKELLGLYLTAHPLDEHSETLKTLAYPIKDLANAKGKITIGGVVTKIQKILTKKGDQMAFAYIEDKTGSVEALFFPTTYSQFKDLLVEEKILLLEGKVNDKDGIPKFLVDQAKEFPPELYSGETRPLKMGGGQTSIPSPTNPKSVTIRIPETVSEEIFVELKKIFETFPGSLEVNLMIKEQRVKTPFRVDVSDEFRSRVAGLFGGVANPNI